MPVVRRSKSFMGSVVVNQIVLQRANDVEYYKSVPLGRFEMLGLNIRQDLRDAHAYLYRNGREVDKAHLVWRIPDNCLLRVAAFPDRPLVLHLPDSVSTFSSCATASGLSVEIRRLDRGVVLTPEREGVIFFVAFTGGYKAWEPLPTASYLHIDAPSIPRPASVGVTTSSGP